LSLFLLALIIFQRQIIKDSLKLVELKLLRLIEKPLCDIIYLNFRSQFAEKKTILCYNLGSGYLSLSIIDIEDDGIIEVKAIDGKNIGGEDFDNILVEYCSDEFRKKYGIDFIDNKKALIKVKEACEDAKIFLSSSESAKIQIINLLKDKTLDISINREKFENLCKTLIEKCIEPIHKILEDSKISKKDINEVILVGGSVLIPKITSMIKHIFSENKIEIRIMRNHGIGAFGASLFNAYIKNIKDKNIEKKTIINKSPYSYGCEVSNYNFNIMIPKSSILPFKNSLYFLTKKDKQTSFEIKAFQIDNENSSIKYPLANLYFYPISPLPSGQVKIIVTYDLDIDLNLNISVIETMTNKKIERNIFNEDDDISLFNKCFYKFKKIKYNFYNNLSDINNNSKENLNINNESNPHEFKNMTENENIKLKEMELKNNDLKKQMATLKENLDNEVKNKMLLNEKINQLTKELYKKNTNEDKNKDLKKEIELLKMELYKEINNNKELNIKINQLNKQIEERASHKEDNKDKIMELYDELRTKEKELKEIKSRSPFILKPGEKLMTVIIVSTDQKIHYSIICKNTDHFLDIEKLLYNEYPEYKENKNIFLFNGKVINEYKNLEENKINNSDIITLTKID